MIAAAEVPDVRGSHSRGTRIHRGTCMQNSRIILSKYLNVKLLTHNYSGRREERLVSLVCLVNLVCLVKQTNQMNKTNQINQINPSRCRAFPASLARLA